MIAPKMATPKELPIERKKTLDEVAAPRSFCSAAFWRATMRTGMIRPTPMPSGNMNRPAFQIGVCWFMVDSRNMPNGISTDPMMGQSL